ncbi:hypothetical protein Pst134EA_002536 [Puccinia striiformis f. sp. tritici]|uniref:hypothetical protein n=1 Tax=Puccinia striiformis f. sp. tritici TaxID=168172 RepID=UPI0020079E8E|nr:hypothetical protein Pst134EA_002536 [Puccinia striiformis f. sp. tritici]KAH9471905.1 hypothetical protein Pst134EA_002536 [Puccinia striiformis f. sp. tritici]
MKIASTLSPFYSVGMFRAYAILTLTHFLATVIPGSAAHPAWQQEVKSTTTALNRVENDRLHLCENIEQASSSCNFPIENVKQISPPNLSKSLQDYSHKEQPRREFLFKELLDYPTGSSLTVQDRLDIEENWSNHEAELMELEDYEKDSKEIFHNAVAQYEHLKKHQTIEEETEQAYNHLLFVESTYKKTRKLMKFKLLELGKVKSPGGQEELNKFVEKFVDEIKEQIKTMDSQGMYFQRKDYHNAKEERGKLLAVPICLMSTIQFLYTQNFIDQQTTRSLLLEDGFLSNAISINSFFLEANYGFSIHEMATDLPKQWLWPLGLSAMQTLNKEDALRINFEFLTSDEFIPKEGYRELELLLKSIKRRNYVHKLKTVPKIKEFRFLNEEDMEDVERDVEQLGKILLKTLDRKKNHKLVYIESRSLSSKICELLDFFELNLHPGIIKKISKKSGMPQGFEEQHKLMLMFTRMTFNQEMQRSFDEFTLNYPGTYLFHGLDIKSIYEYYNNTLKNLLKSFTNLHQSVLSNRNDDALSHWLNEQMDLRILANTPQVDHQKWEDNWEKVKSETEKIKYWP